MISIISIMMIAREGERIRGTHVVKRSPFNGNRAHRLHLKRNHNG